MQQVCVLCRHYIIRNNKNNNNDNNSYATAITFTSASATSTAAASPAGMIIKVEVEVFPIEGERGRGGGGYCRQQQQQQQRGLPGEEVDGGRRGDHNSTAHTHTACLNDNWRLTEHDTGKTGKRRGVDGNRDGKNKGLLLFYYTYCYQADDYCPLISSLFGREMVMMLCCCYWWWFGQKKKLHSKNDLLTY